MSFVYEISFQKKFEGTRVTVETFLKWKAKFEEEMGILKKREALEREGKKLTGRELFLQDKTLNESDLKFLDEGTYDTEKLSKIYIFNLKLHSRRCCQS